MAVGFDAASESHGATTPSTSEASFTWNHLGGAGPAGVLVFVFNMSSTTDTATSVTYGGVTIPEVAGGRAVDAAGEPGSCKAFFLGDVTVIPTGTQAVVVNRTNNADQMYAVCFTVTAAAGWSTGVWVNGINLVQTDGTVAEIAVTDGGSPTNSMRFAGGFFGHQTAPSAGASSSNLQSIDVGATCAMGVRETTAGTGSRSVGFSSGTSDDRAIVTLAVREVHQAAKAALSLVGQALTLAAGIAIATASLVLTGIAPTVALTAHVLTTPAAGGATLTGTSFEGRATGNLDTAQLVLTGLAPTVVADEGTNTTRTPDAGILTVAGTTPALEFRVPPEAGALTLSGTTPALAFQIPPPEGALNLVGTTPSLADGRPVEAGSLTLTGAAPSLSSTIPVTAGGLSLSGTTPILAIDLPLAPAAGVLTLSGATPSLAWAIEPAAGSLVLTGTVPSHRSPSRFRSLVASSPLQASLRSWPTRCRLRPGVCRWSAWRRRLRPG
jgi:hypothetical protein